MNTYTSLLRGSGDFFQSRFNVKIHVLVHSAIASQFYIRVNVEFYVHINVELILHAFKNRYVNFLVLEKGASRGFGVKF